MNDRAALPNLFLLAPPRSGTTQLSHWLIEHPDIARPRVKEPNYYSSGDFDPDYVHRTRLDDIDPARVSSGWWNNDYQFAIFRERVHYLDLYRSLHTIWRLDGSTSYLTSPTASDRLAEELNDPRLLIVLRDPVERALSHHRLARRTGRTTAPLLADLREELAGITPPEARYLVAPSRYSAALDRWQAAFPERCFHVIAFEQLVADPTMSLRRIFEWLELPPHDVDLAEGERNEGAAPRFPAVNAILYRTGAKTTLRRLTPTSLKRRLKRFYFTDHTTETTDDSIEVRAALETVLADERTEIAARHPAVAEHWARRT